MIIFFYLINFNTLAYVLRILLSMHHILVGAKEKPPRL